MVASVHRPLILLVDDTPANLRVLVEALQPLYEIEVATNGETALALAGASQPPALILLDIMMPGMDGYEVCRRLKAEPRTRGIPVIFVTARTDPASEEHGFELGAVDYITKPFNVSVVRARVRTHLTLQGLLEQLEALNRRLTERLSELTRTHRALQHSRERESIYARAFEHTADGILIADASGAIVAVNPAFTRITGYAEAEALGQTPRLLRSGQHTQDFYAELWRVLIDKGYWAGEMINRRKDGSLYPTLNAISAIRDAAGQVTHYVSVFSDISTLKRFQERLDYLTWFDPLTGAGNRLLFMDRLRQTIALCGRRQACASMLLINIDRFRLFNEARGPAVADRVLRELATRVQAQLREGDSLARLAADEFGVVLQDPHLERDAAAQAAFELAEQIRVAVAGGIELDGVDLHLTVSIGAALLHAEGPQSAETALQHAVTARNGAATAGGDRVVFFEHDMGAHVIARFDVEQELHRALARDQLALYVQPQVDDAGVVVGFEALVRWRHPQRGLVAPLEFIPVAEQTGLIVTLERWVLEQACAARMHCHANGAAFSGAVNISPRHIREHDFVAAVTDIVRRHRLPAGALTLELTESVLVDDVEDVAAKMEALRAQGVRFSIDDFGVGYSSLRYLRRLPIDELKIDRSFVEGIGRSAGDAAVIDAILAVARQLRFDVVAEGLETSEQVAFFDARRPVRRQGFWYGRPLPVGDWLARRAVA